MINEQRLESIFCKTQEQLHKYLIKKLKSYGYEIRQSKKNFVYAEGNMPVMLVAHLDTVHKKTASFICKAKNGIWMSPDGIGGDDRCGIELILSVLDTGRRPHVLFTHDEETGGDGATYFTQTAIKPDINFIVEFDRKGNKDAVFYDCENHDFISFVEKFGFEEDWGTFSDISIVAPHLKVAAVNLSSGYYNAHTQHEYVSIPDMNSIFERSLPLIDDNKTKFEYVEAKYSRWDRHYDATYSRYGYWDYYKDFDWDYEVARKGKSKEDDKKKSEKETENLKSIDLMEVPTNGYVMFGDDYFDGCDAMFYVDEEGAVYMEDDETSEMCLLYEAYAFDVNGNELKYDDKTAIHYLGKIDTMVPEMAY